MFIFYENRKRKPNRYEKKKLFENCFLLMIDDFRKRTLEHFKHFEFKCKFNLEIFHSDIVFKIQEQLNFIVLVELATLVTILSF